MISLNRINKSISNLASICGLSEKVESVDTIEKAAEFVNGVGLFDEYLSYRYFDEENGLFLNDNNIVGFMLEIAPIVGVDDGLYKNLEHFFNDELPEYSYLQFLLVADHDTQDMLKFWQKASTNDNEFLEKVTSRRVEFIQNQAKSFGINDGRIARNYRVFVIFSKQIGHKESSETSAIVSFKTSFINKLASLSLAPRICGTNDLIRLVRTCLQMELEPQREANYRDIELLSKQILDPAHIHNISKDEIQHITTGLVSRLYHIKELPQEFSLVQNVNLLGDGMRNSMGIAARFIISYTVASNINAGGKRVMLAKGKRVIDAADKWYSKHDRNIKRESAEWQEVIDRINNEERLLSEHWQLMVTTTKETMDTVHQNLISLYNINNFRLEVTTHLQLLSMLSILPMQAGLMWKYLSMFRLTRSVLSKEVIARLPIHAEWKGVPKAGVLLHGRRGQLFNFNPFYRISSGNYNICVFAPSGGGKSVFLQELALQLSRQNTRIFILDIGQSSANICKGSGGEIIQFGRTSGFSLNPFASFYSGMSTDDRDEFLRCTKSLLELMCAASDDPRGAAELEKAIIASLEANNYQLNIDSFAKFLEASNSTVLQKYGATLYPYTKDGIYGKYFSGSKVARFKSLITVFEFEEIKNEPRLLAIVLQILLIEVTNQFLTGDRQTLFMIIVDEAWMLLDFAASFFAAFGRTVRKYGGSLVICVQNFTDLQKTQEHKTILENSTWTILLKQDEKGLSSFKESEAFKDKISLIKSISLSPNKYAEMLIYTTGVSVVGRLVLDDYSKALYSTDAADFAQIQAKMKQGISLDQALEELVYKKSGKG